MTSNNILVSQRMNVDACDCIVFEIFMFFSIDTMKLFSIFIINKHISS